MKGMAQVRKKKVAVVQCFGGCKIDENLAEAHFDGGCAGFRKNIRMMRRDADGGAWAAEAAWRHAV